MHVRRHILAAAVLATLGLLPLPTTPAAAQTAQPDRIVFHDDPQMTGVGEVRSVRPDGTGQRVIAQGSAPDLSPDGRRVVFHRCDPETGTRCDLRHVAVEGGTQTVVAAPASATHPRWAPGGDRLAFLHGEGRAGIVRLDGSAFRDLRQLGLAQQVQSVDWAPDGSLLVTDRDAAVVRRVFTDGRAPQVVFQGGRGHLRSATPSPDGTQIAMVRTPSPGVRHAPFEVELINADGSGQRFLGPLLTTGLQAGWSPDSRRLVVVASSTGGGLGLHDLNGRRVATLTQRGFDPSWANPSRPVPCDSGYWLVAADGGIFSFGNARFHGSTGAMRLNQPIVGMTGTRTGGGYWLVASDGGIFSFGDARFFGSTGAMRLNQPIVGMARTPTGNGYYLVARDGGIFTFGDARFRGSTGAMRLNQPIVGMALTPTGNGYWLVAADGGIFTFGDAGFFGSTGNIRLVAPITGMAATPTSRGYWLAAADGGIFSFGDAPFLGSFVPHATGWTPPPRPLGSVVVSAAGTPGAPGVLLASRDGQAMPLGAARFCGSMFRTPLAQPVVGVALRS